MLVQVPFNTDLKNSQVSTNHTDSFKRTVYVNFKKSLLKVLFSLNRVLKNLQKSLLNVLFLLISKEL